MGQEIRILLVDDHSLFRESLSRLLQAEPDLRIVATCSNATEALAIVEREAVDLVLLDFDLGEQEGSLFLDSVKARSFAGRILMVTAGMSDAGTLRAMEAGAAGIFLKHSPPAQLLEAIYKVMRGEMFLDSRAVRSLVAGASGKSEEQRTSQPFTQRERAVLKGVFEGFTNKEIAGQLEISEGSVKAVLQQLFDKTGVRTRSQLVRMALESFNQNW
jgi:two-component system, NarL family, nitrate/nitrite response regulator NarL